jgi:hypothetical protein
MGTRTPQIVMALAEHIPLIDARVRPEDKAELWAAACFTPTEAMEHGLKSSSIARTGFIGSDAVCMFGVTGASIMSSTGRPWMVGTDLLDRNAMIFLRLCRAEVFRMLIYYKRLENYVDLRNERAITWLSWLGFDFEQPAPMGPFNLPFVKFTMERG